MYSVSEQYKDAIKNSNPSYITGTITFKDGSSSPISNSNLALGGISITMQSVTQDVLEFGAAIIGQLDISLRVPSNESRYKYYDAVINLAYHVEHADNVETIPLGIWTVSEAERDKEALVMTAYDNLIKFNEDLAESLLGTPFEIMSKLAEDCGCELAEDEEYYNSLPNGDQIISIMPGTSCDTYRQALSIVAQLCGAFVQADRSGKISMKQFSVTETFPLSKAERYSSTIADFECVYTDIVISGLQGTYTSISEEVETGITMYMDDAPAWDEGLDEVLQARADNLREYLDLIKYTPCELSIPSDPSIDCGDYIILETDTGSVGTIITSYTWNYNGKMEIQSVGKNPYLLSSSANTKRLLRDFEAHGGGGGGNSALYVFKNIRATKITNKSDPIAQLTFVASQDTFALFSATLQVDVTLEEGSTNLRIQYYINGTALGPLYVQKVDNGSHIITLHYPLSNIKANSINRFAVYMSRDAGVINVAKEMFVGTVSGNGLAGTPKWDGTITVYESVLPFSIYDLGATLSPIKEEISITKLKPGTSNVGETIRKFSMSELGPTIKGFATTIGFEKIVTNYTVESDKAINYVYNPDLVNTNNGFRLRDTYNYEAVEQEIDRGRMQGVTIPTDDKASVEGLEVNV